VTKPIRDYLEEHRVFVDRILDRYLPDPKTPPAVIHEAMRYAVLGGGKRIRPILAIAAAEACGAAIEPLAMHLASLELIHTYSLVHDDLPALDNDDLRRGRKTTHVVFGEAMGILAGDALLTEAFSWLSRPAGGVAPEKQLRAINVVAMAVDSKGMIGGQVADLEATGAGGGLAELEFIHRNKTGQLITASVLLGGLLANATDVQIDALERYGVATGLLFQIVDDLLDIEASSEQLGKTAGKDVAQGKLTFPALLGVETTRARARELRAVAEEKAGMIGGPVNYLAQIARFIFERRS